MLLKARGALNYESLRIKSGPQSEILAAPLIGEMCVCTGVNSFFVDSKSALQEQNV